MAKAGVLDVLMNGRNVGHIRMAASGAITLQYAQTWLDWEHSLPISLSLPLREQAHQGAPVIAYLENLLPDNQAIRERVAAKVKASGTDAFSMLEKIGRDCVGALQFVSGAAPTFTALEGEDLSHTQIAEMLRNLATAPLGIEDDDFRISLAGAQEKTALLKHNGEWVKPHGLTPTTHILKTQLGILPDGIDLTDSVENEFLCMTFCRAMGAEVAEVEIVDFEDVRALSVTRFDRRWAKDGRLLRLPQEDFCQALGVPPSRKYQKDDGPTVSDGLKLLAASNKPTHDQRTFFQAQILFWLMGATDGHAKNFSLALRPGGGFQMTPLYDILTVQKAVDDGQLRRNRMRLAMSLGDNNHYKVNEVLPRHFAQTAKNSGFGVDVANKILAETYAEIDRAIEATVAALPDGFPTKLVDSTVRGIRSRAVQLQV